MTEQERKIIESLPISDEVKVELLKSERVAIYQEHEHKNEIELTEGYNDSVTASKKFKILAGEVELKLDRESKFELPLETRSHWKYYTVRFLRKPVIVKIQEMYDGNKETYYRIYL